MLAKEKIRSHLSKNADMCDRDVIRENSDDPYAVNLESESEFSECTFSSVPSVGIRNLNILQNVHQSGQTRTESGSSTPISSKKRRQFQKNSNQNDEGIITTEFGQSVDFEHIGENVDDVVDIDEAYDSDIRNGGIRHRRTINNSDTNMVVDGTNNQNPTLDSSAFRSEHNQLLLSRGLLPDGQRARFDSRLRTLVDRVDLILMSDDDAEEILEEFRSSYKVAEGFLFQKVTRDGDRQTHITDLRDDINTMSVEISSARTQQRQQNNTPDNNAVVVNENRQNNRRSTSRSSTRNSSRRSLLDEDEQHVAAQQIETVSLLLRITPTLMSNIMHYVTQLFARRHLESLVQNGVIQPRHDPNDPSSFILDPRNRNLLVADVGATISPSALVNAIATETKRMWKLSSDIINTTALNPSIKSEVSQKMAHLTKMHLHASSALMNVAHIVYSETAPSVAAASSLEATRIATNPFDCTPYDFVLRVANILNVLNIRKGPNPNRFYMERYVDLYSPTKFWRAESTIENVISELLRDRASIGDKLHEHWTVNRDQSLRHIKQSDEALIPTVAPRRHFVAFRNGWLDIEKNLFFERGTPSCINVMSRQSERYDYALNYFDGNFDSSGYSPETGEFDWTDRIPTTYNPNGWIDWERDNMPQKHWSREEDVPIVSHAVRTQRWDFHTEQNFWFACGRTLRPAVDKLQFMLSVIGKPETGKSTICEMILNFFPKDRVMIFAANGEKVFQFQTLIDQDEETFNKYIAAVLDLNGSISLPYDFICNVASQEVITTPVKNEVTRSAKCDMHMIWAGNKFLDMKKTQMPALLRRFWVFKMDIKPKVFGNTEVNADTMAKAMPSFIRRMNLVYHEFQQLKHNSDSNNIRNSLMIWEFASQATRTTMLGLAKEISTAANMLSSQNWFTRDPLCDIDNWIPIHVLRMISQFYFCVQAGDFKRRIVPPKESDFADAIHILWSGRVHLEEWGSKESIEFLRSSGATREDGSSYDDIDIETGYKTKFDGAIMKKHTYYVRGLILNPDRLEPFLKYFKSGQSHLPEDGSVSTPPRSLPIFRRKTSVLQRGDKDTEDVTNNVSDNTRYLDFEDSDNFMDIGVASFNAGM